MYSLKETIFPLFGRHSKINDTYKDVNGKGIFERFNESIGEDFDEQIGDKINNYADNLIVPSSASIEFIPYLETMMGGLVKMFEDISFRRKLIKFATKIYAIKGTKRSYEMLFKMAGFTSVVITEDFSGTGLDSPLTFDDPDRRFDQNKCRPCSDYSLELSGPANFDVELSDIIFNVIEFLEPINAKLAGITYNAVDIAKDIIEIRKDNQGNVYYDNYNDPMLMITIENGIFKISGPNAAKYSIDKFGNVKYIG